MNKNPSVHRTWRAHLVPVLLLTVAAIALTYPLAFRLGSALPDDADPLLNAWILAWDAHILPKNPLELYNANDFYPYSNTLAYSEALLGQAVFTMPIIWITGNPILAVNFATLISYTLSGIGMYALTYRFTQHRAAALIAGMAFAFNPFRFAHLNHLQLLSAQWVPFALLFLDRLVHRPSRRNLLGLIVFTNLQFLSSYYYALFFAVGLGVLGLGYLLTEGEQFSARLWGYLAISVAITVLIQVPLSIPYFRVAESMGFERNLEDAAGGGADLTDFLTAPPENHLFGEITARWRSEGWWEHVTFPGVTTALVAMLGIVGSTSNDRAASVRRLYLGLTLTAAVLSLGPALRLSGRTVFEPMPYALLYNYVPGFQAVRQPARFHMFTMVGLSVLAGFGTRTLLGAIGKPVWRRALPGLLAGLIAVENLGIPLTLTAVPKPDEIPPVYRWIADEAEPGPLLELPITMDVGSTESPRLYYSTQHWKRLVNGYGGFYPPTYAYFLFFDREFPSQPYDWIVGLGVRYVVLHRGQYSAEELERIDQDLHGFKGLRLVADFDSDVIYEVMHPNTGRPNMPRTDQTWAHKIRLLGFVAEPVSPKPGTTLKVKLFWQSFTRQIEKDYTVFVHLIDAEGALVAQHDGQPGYGELPTSRWRYEEVVPETRTLVLPETLPPGTYTLRVGLYDLTTMQRLEVLDIDGRIVRDFSPLCDLNVRPD